MFALHVYTKSLPVKSYLYQQIFNTLNWTTFVLYVFTVKSYETKCVKIFNCQFFRWFSAPGQIRCLLTHTIDIKTVETTLKISALYLESFYRKSADERRSKNKKISDFLRTGSDVKNVYRILSLSISLENFTKICWSVFEKSAVQNL